MRDEVRFARARWAVALFLVLAGLGATAYGQDDAPPAATTATAPAEDAAEDGAEGWFPDPTRTRPLPKLPETVTRAYLIPIRGMIGEATYDALRRKSLKAIGKGAELIIFEFDTPGGLVSAADEIVKLIRRDLGDIRTVAFVNPNAISAGAWIALACNEIVMTPDAKLGDAAPVTMQGELTGTPREKMESYLREDFSISAEQNGYPTALVEAMVSADLEIWLVKNVDTAELRYVKADEYASRVKNDPTDTEQPERPTAQWEVVRVVVPEGRLLTMRRSLAQEYGFLRAGVADLEGLRELYHVSGEPELLADTWSERVADFLTSPAVTGILTLLLIFFAYVEINTPGLGLPGALALVCLLILFASRYVTGLAQVWEIAVFVLGVLLLAAEIFVTPGFGVLGVLGLLFCAVGLLASLIGNPPGELPWPTGGLIMDAFLMGLLAMGVGVLAGCVACIVAARYLPHLPLASRLVLAGVPAGSAAPGGKQAPIHRLAPGDEGVVESLCRPSGRARFGEDLVDVMSDGEFLVPGTRVVVMRNEGNRLLVRPKSEA